jgi:hypothetical protein
MSNGLRFGDRSIRVIWGDVQDDDGDVVAATLFVRCHDQLFGSLRRTVDGSENVGDHLSVHLVAQAVRAKEIAVADLGDELPGVQLDNRSDAEGPREDVTLRMLSGLVGSQLSACKQFLSDGVISSQLLESAVSKQVCTRVADVHEREPVFYARRVFDQCRHCESGAHSAKIPFGATAIPYCFIRLLDGREKAFDRRLALEGGLKGIDGRASRYVTTRVTTHPVGDPI